MCLAPAKLLYTGYNYGDRKLDIYGLPPTEDDSCIIDSVTLAGTRVDVMYLLDEEALRTMQFWLDAGLHAEWIAERDQARVDRAIHDREMALTDHQWRSL